MILDIIVFIIINIIGFKLIGSWFLLVELILFIVFLIWLWIKKYRPVIDNVSVFTGAPGTGKSKFMVDVALQKYRSNLLKVKLNNIFIKFFNLFRKKSKKKDLLERPLLFSNIPIRISRKEFSRVLTQDIVLLQKRLPYRSVVVIDELSELANNQDWKNVFARYNLTEFVRFMRQYTLGGYLFMADQSSDDILVQLRRRVGKVYNMMSFRKIPLLNIGISNVRHISISEDIKVIEEGHAESLKHNTSWIPLFFYRKTYDTYAFSERVKYMEKETSKEFKKFKTNKLLDIPYITDKKDSKYKETKTLKDD